MEKYYNDTKYAGYRGFSPHPKGSGKIGKAIKWIAIILGSIIGLIIAAAIFLMLYFTPKRITGIAEEEAGKYLNGTLYIENLDYSFFKSFPWLKIEIDSLSLVSKALENIPDSAKVILPPDADHLFSCGKLTVSINIRKLIKDKIELGDISVANPSINIVQVNDEIANYNIFPPIKKPSTMPKLRIGTVRISEPLSLSFFMLQKDLEANLILDKFFLSRFEKEKNKYHLSLSGNLEGSYGEYSLPLALPLNIDGDFAFDLKPLSATISDFKVDIAPLSSCINLAVTGLPDDVTFQSLNLSANLTNLFELEKYIPLKLLNKEKEIPYSVEGNLPVSFDFILDSPLLLTKLMDSKDPADNLPSFRFYSNIGESWLKIIKNGKRFAEISDFLLQLEGGYDSANIENTYLKIPQLSLAEGGMRLCMDARIENPLTDGRSLTGNLDIDADLTSALKSILREAGMKLSGEMAAKITFSADIPEIKVPDIENLSIKGNMSIPRLSMAEKTSATFLNNFTLTFSGKLPDITLDNFNANDLSVDIGASKILMTTGKNVSLSVNDFSLELDVPAFKSASQTIPPADLKMEGANLIFKEPGTSLSLNGFEFDIDGKNGSITKNNPFVYNNLYNSEGDSIILSRVSHSPAWLTPGVGAMLQMIPMCFDINVKINDGSLDTDAYVARTTFGDVDIFTNIDSVAIRSLEVTIDDSALQLSGNISNLVPFLSSLSPSPLKLNLDARFNNVDINRLSGAYYAGIEKITGKPYDFTMSPQGSYTAADSLCVLIPRNIDAVVRLHSDRAEYMDFSFAPLSTDIIVKEGNATLSRLSIGTPYTDVTVNWTYSTKKADDIFMDITADVSSFNFMRFFSSFPMLTAKAPEIKNLGGSLSANVGVRFIMFPSMFLNMASLEGKFDVVASDLTFSRSGKIEKFTHLMGIEGDKPINIRDINIGGSFHDNLLILKPFKIKFDDYQIGVAGVNNLKGGMYYHVALEKSPFHLPFAVNLVGKFSHPEVRFGGIDIKDGREREISSILESDTDINIMTNLRRGWQMFIEAAAKYDLTHQH